MLRESSHPENRLFLQTTLPCGVMRFIFPVSNRFSSHSSCTMTRTTLLIPHHLIFLFRCISRQRRGIEHPAHLIIIPSARNQRITLAPILKTPEMWLGGAVGL